MSSDTVSTPMTEHSQLVWRSAIMLGSIESQALNPLKPEPLCREMLRVVPKQAQSSEDVALQGSLCSNKPLQTFP